MADKENKVEPTQEGASAEVNTSQAQPSQEEIAAQLSSRMEQLQANSTDKAWNHQARVMRNLGKEGLSATTTADVEGQAAAKPVKVGTSSAKTDMHGDMSAEDVKRMQAMLGAAKSKDSKVFANLKGENITVAAGDIDPRSTLVFANCNDCTFVIDSLCTKVFVQSCASLNLTFNAKIVTHTVEMYKCSAITGRFGSKIGTMQLDLVEGCDITFKKQAHFGSIIWAGCQQLSVKFDDSEQTALTGFDAMQEDYADLNKERSQFKMSFVAGKLLNEKVVRLANGFPTTKREKDAFEARQERNMKAAAEAMGIVVPNKKKEGPKVGRNDPCSCASGRKYKKCCGLNA
eukprot:TRINITY_DN9534_c0_g1_i1.p1 TRINITY_DN9534_c0_g1~~TRINITY_DN9534_c0_g1_i1.p1  ORF type:complete len:345 (+),score=99.96 TRINITY_DN9534_c0_g1_i1:97-1131(+)